MCAVAEVASFQDPADQYDKSLNVSWNFTFRWHPAPITFVLTKPFSIGAGCHLKVKFQLQC